MADILDEILNDEKDSKRVVLFRKTFPSIIVATIVIAVLMASYSWFSASQKQKNQEVGDLFVQLVSEEYKPEKINDLLEEIKLTRENNVSELAALKLIQNQLNDGNVLSAMDEIQQIVLAKENSEITKIYARILYLNLFIDQTEVNDKQAQVAQDYFAYFNDESQLFYSTATLLKSIFYFTKQDYNMAKKYATEVIALSRSSAILKDQARALLSAMN